MMDKRSREEIQNEIIELSKSYTPQWRYHTEAGDVGTALAVIFGEMLYGTKEKLNMLFQKNKIVFFNQLHADLLPAKAARGYVTFGLVNEDVPGVEVEAGTRVIADAADSEHAEIAFEVEEPVFATPAGIAGIYQVSDDVDYIEKEERVDNHWSIQAFQTNSTNLQQHELYICHRDLMHIKTKGTIEILFYKNPYELIPNELAKQLTEKEHVSIEYFSEKGFCEFENVEARDGKIIVSKSEKQPSFSLKTIRKHKNYWIVLRLKNGNTWKGLSCQSVRLNAYSYEITPQVIHGAGIECTQIEYKPFGCKMGIYQEVVFGSNEVLSKKGATVHLRFDLEFKKIPLESNVDYKVNWKWNMKESDFEKEPEYEISIGEVIWEYYTKNGWRRLFEDESYADAFCFTGRYSKRCMDIVFEVPVDIAYTVVNSRGSHYIRARILTMNHEYKTNGYYITPILSETKFDFIYDSSEIQPQYIATKNNMQERLIEGTEIGEKEKLFFAEQMDCRQKSLYLGFLAPPAGGPIKMLFQLKQTISEVPHLLKWEYCSKHGFVEMNVTDETENFRKTGIVTFTGCDDFSEKRMFNQELYWMRIVDVNDYYQEDRAEFPHICGIFMNTTKVKACQSYEKQQFRISQYEIHQKLQLSKGEILSVQVWIDEGVETEKRILWEEVPDFLDSDSNDRHYTVDAQNGIIMFGDGVSGRVPPMAEHNNVWVEFRTGGGSYTNVKPFRIRKLEKSMGYINRTANHLALLGGCDRETTQESIQRNAACLKHRNKAVTLTDYEEIARESSGTIHRVKCFKHIDRYGNRKEGMLTLCIIQKDYEMGYLYFEALKGQIFDYLKVRCDQSVLNENNLCLTEPVLLKIDVNLKVSTSSFESVFRVKEQVQERIENFLHPFYGNVHGNGFELSEIPDMVQMKHIIYSISGIAGIVSTQLSYYLCRGGDVSEVDLETAQKCPFALVMGGNHNISVQVSP